MKTRRSFLPENLKASLYNTYTYKIFRHGKHIGAFVLLIFILLIAGWIRIQEGPEIPEGQFTSLDAYFHYWQVELIAEQGKLPTRDMHRWLPLGRNLDQTLPFYSYALAYFHKVLRLFFPNVSLYNIVFFAPVCCFLIGVAVLCLFFYQVFGFNVAVTVGLLLAFMPGSVDRSSAGFGDRDSWCLCLGILAVTTYLWREQIQHRFHRFLFTALSGFFVFLGGLSWEGFGVFVLIILCSELWRFLASDREQYFTEYLLWVFMFVPWLYLLSPAYRQGAGFSTHLAALVLFPPLAVLGIRALQHFLTNYRSVSQFIQKRISMHTVALILTIGCLILAVSYVFSQRVSFAQHTVPFNTHRVMQTVSELDSPQYIFWQFRYGGVFLLGCLGVIGGSARIWGKKGTLLTVTLYIFALSTFFRSSLYQLLSPIVCEYLFCISIGFMPVAALAVVWLGKKPIKNEMTYVVIAAWFLFWVGLARGAKRYDFFVGVPLAFFAAELIRFVSVFISEKWQTHKGFQTVLKTGVSVAVLMALLLWEPAGSMEADFLAKRGVLTPIKMHRAIPGRNTSQGIALENVLNWMKAEYSGKENAVVAAEWSYGSILNVLGRVKTIVDQDHFILHWIHLYSRHVFCAQSEREALEFLRTHEATHLMLTESNVRYPLKISRVGSDKNLDRQFDMVMMRVVPSSDGSSYRMVPSVENTFIKFIDIDFGRPVSVTARLKTGKNISLPYVVIFEQGEVERNLCEENTNGGIVHYFHENPQQNIVYYIPPIGWNSLAIKLFFGGMEIPHFVPVYPQEDFSTAKVKVWKIHYPSDIKPNPKYRAIEPTE